jgi:hypothetical protein
MTRLHALVRVIALLVIAAPLHGQARPPAGQQTPTDLQIRQAASAIEQADGYADMVAAIERHADVISSPRVVEMVDALLANTSISDAQRGLLMLERQLSIDCRAVGAATAAKLLAIRAIASSALTADTPQQFAVELNKFSPLASTITVDLVRQALNTPGNSWPRPLFPLMEQLARDWPALGALGAATKMSAAANGAPAPGPAAKPAPSPAPAGAPTLAGHWRRTSIVFENARDEHLILREDGTAETWTVTASSRTPATPGRWTVSGTQLSVAWEDGREWGQPFTFYQGQLVFPNVPNGRQFWEAIR